MESSREIARERGGDRSKAISGPLKRSRSSPVIHRSRLHYDCSTCPKIFLTFEAFKQHLKECVSSRIASIETEQKAEDEKIDDDEKRKFGLGVYKCTTCGTRWNTIEALDRHKKECAFSRRASKSSIETEHKAEDEDDDEKRKLISFGCRICKLSFPSVKDFVEHNTKLHPCPAQYRSQSTFKETPQEDEYDKNLEKLSYHCQFCRDTFTSSQRLDHHISVDHHPSLLAIMSGQKDVKEIIGDVDVDEDGGKEIWLANESAIACLRNFALAALEHYNNQNVGKRYVLVKHGPNQSTGTIDHVNFRAKEEDCPGAPVETFFAQLTHAPFMRVDCCVSLGPSRNLPDWRTEAQLGGCCFCHPMIIHPLEKVANLILDPYSLRP